jgi:exonuclease VII large subunit
LNELLVRLVLRRKELLTDQHAELNRGLRAAYSAAQLRVQTARQLLAAYDPTAALQRGYALVRGEGGLLLRGIGPLKIGGSVEITLRDGVAQATITGKEPRNGKEN